jgi:hypothetical protein
MEEEIAAEIDAAVAFAEASPGAGRGPHTVRDVAR